MDRTTDSVAPYGWLQRLRRKGVSRRLHEILETVLTLKYQSRPDARGLNLFEQGGDSLDAIACALALEKDYRVDIPLELFLTNTPAMLANHVLRTGRPAFHRIARDVVRGFFDVLRHD